MNPLPNAEIERVFLSYPESIRKKLYLLRDLILHTAQSIEAVGPITETLKWGEPAYLTEKTKSGSTLRIGWKTSSPTQYAMYFNCRTSLVDTYRTLFPELKFAGSRALLFDESEDPPAEPVSKCIRLALMYHLDKRTTPRVK